MGNRLPPHGNRVQNTNSACTFRRDIHSGERRKLHGDSTVPQCSRGGIAFINMLGVLATQVAEPPTLAAFGRRLAGAEAHQ